MNYRDVVMAQEGYSGGRPTLKLHRVQVVNILYDLTQYDTIDEYFNDWSGFKDWLFPEDIEIALYYCKNLKCQELNKFCEHCSLDRDNYIEAGDKEPNFIDGWVFAKELRIKFGFENPVQVDTNLLKDIQELKRKGFSLLEFWHFLLNSEAHLDAWENIHPEQKRYTSYWKTVIFLLHQKEKINLLKKVCELAQVKVVGNFLDDRYYFNEFHLFYIICNGFNRGIKTWNVNSVMEFFGFDSSKKSERLTYKGEKLAENIKQFHQRIEDLFVLLETEWQVIRCVPSNDEKISYECVFETL